MTDREKFEAWFRDAEQAELRKSCAEGWAFTIWQAAAVSQEQLDDDWIKWLGGKSPVYGLVEVKFRSGKNMQYYSQLLFWGRGDYPLRSDIIAYRILKS